ncbi:protein-glutamate methylesterase/protein-glutamine glutaminase [Lichenicoccus roseus]|uniref:Protein-glutamate methylesterase/protein-glutamine glutaminase n=1 Tax=Lichenicoccus roseus TaxID=2683649 RepID=A0A5R9J6G8_9PROT|nr:chemotaxis response regulator protein-glutamate methylesterase [Lichenicoccus roseus]TLU72453.1 chemotaxis response regulator protein-glutamate methylesterase [Lichenicoccus roseus]
MAIRVLIVDDSALMRQLMTEMLASDPGIEVVGTAGDPYIAREKIKLLAPDVLTLDIEMPRMDGLSFLERLMALRPMPVVVVSTLTQRGTDIALHALELGAVDVVAKPTLGVRDGLLLLREELLTKVKAAAQARPRARSEPATRLRPRVDPLLSAAGRIVAVGASTGGVEALQRLLVDLPADCPAILIAQHMPPGFTASFAKRLDQICMMSVCEATDGQVVNPGHVYIANGARHLELTRSGSRYSCRLHDGAAVSGHRPSVDVLFRSFADTIGSNALGIILTGMGRDGAAGLLAMRQAGAHTLGQSEASCLIYGMPKAAKDIGAVEAEMSLEHLVGAIVRQSR